jgi:polar amino acid transport system substrate-binding protein
VTAIHTMPPGPPSPIGRRRRHRSLALAAALAVGLALAACSSTDVPEALPGPTTATTEAAAAGPPPSVPAGCTEGTEGNVVESLNPGPDFDPANRPATGRIGEILDRGRLRVGVDTSTLLFSIVDRSGEFEGFDIEVAQRVAMALFGDEGGEPPPDRIEYVAIPYSERVDVLAPEDGSEPLVDMVVDTFTINCEREARIDFSTQYFTSFQKLLVPAGGDVESIEDLTPDDRVCAAAGSTSIQNLQDREGGPEPVGVTDQADCLVLLQRGEVDAISTDDTILAGMVAQDPTIAIVGDGFSDEPYGIGVPPGEEAWLRYVNGVLDRMRTDGTWDRLYDDWLLGPMGVDQAPPVPRYEDEG